MENSLAPLAQVRELFGSVERAGDSLAQFRWLVFRRHGKPLLLLPTNFRAATAATQLYAAQRPAARLVRKLLPWYAGTPLRTFGEQFTVQADPIAPLTACLRELGGGDQSACVTPAILIGNQPAAAQRFILLALDGTRSPVAVVKAGLQPQARQIIAREAEVLRQLPADRLGIPKFRNHFDGETGSALAMDYYAGRSPTDAGEIGRILGSWLHEKETLTVGATAVWQELARVSATDPLFVSLNETLANRQVRAAVHHGDFTPWNVKVRSDGAWVVVDWERGTLRGLPGWDWFHYEIQTAILKHRLTAEAVATRVEALFHQPRFKQYAQAAGIAAYLYPLTLAYLLYHNRVIKPGEGLQVGEQLLRWLAQRAALPA